MPKTAQSRQYFYKTTMKKSILSLVLFTITLGASAQTTIGNVGTLTTVQGKDTKITSVYTTYLSGGLGGVQIGSSGKNTTIIGNSTNIQTTYTSLNSAQTFINGEKTVFNQQGTITTINKTGISTAGTITGAKLYTQGLDVGNEIINLKDAVSLKASASSVVNLTNRVTSLENNKADKIQVATDIAQAKAEAKNYTDALETKVNTQVNRLDGRIDALDLKVDATNITVENNRIEAAKATAQVQSNLDATNATVQANKVEAKNYTDAEVNKAKADAKAYTDLESARAKQSELLLKQDIEANNKRAMAAEDQIRQDLRTETQRALQAEQQLSNEIGGVGSMVMAMGALQTSTTFNPSKRGNMSFGIGKYKQNVAYAIGVSYYTTPNTKVSMNFAGFNSKNIGSGLGVSFGF